MNKTRISIEIHDNCCSADSALAKISEWYRNNLYDPKKYPMTGACTYRDNTVIIKQLYRKSDCFAVFPITKDK
jgi:hypothetical protein